MPTMDTLHAYDTLRSKGGFQDAMAKAIVEAMTGLITPSFADLATKADLLAIKADLHAEIQSVKADLLVTKADLHTEIQSVKADLHTEIQSVKADLRGWFLASVITIISATAVMLQLMR